MDQLVGVSKGLSMGLSTEAKGRAAAVFAADVRIWLFAAGLGAFAATLFVRVLPSLTHLDSPLLFPLWAFIALFAMAETCVVHIDLRRQVFSASLTEIPLVLGMYFIDPRGLVLSYVIGAAIALVIHRRQRILKLFFNLCHLALQASLAVIVFHAVLGNGDPVRPRGWLAVLAAVVVTDVFASLVITAAMSLAEGGRMHLLPQLMSVGTVASFANTTLGLTAATILWARIEAAWLLAFPASLLLLAYRAYAHQRHKHESLERLYGSTRAIQQSLGRESIVEAVLDQARQMLKADMAEIILFPPHGENSAERTLLGPGDSVSRENNQLDATEGVWGRVASDGQGLLLVPPIANERLRVYLATQGIRDAIVAPLRNEQEITGTLLVANRMGDIASFDEQDLKMLETLAAHASMSLEKGRLVESLQEQATANQYLAEHDTLTGLLNRSHFGHLVEAAIRNSRRSEELVAVLLIDLDRFKEINDTLGHNVGDEVLIDLGKRLVEILPKGAQLARVGGDEFAVLLPAINDIALATDLAKEILDLMKHPIHLADATLDVIGSIGVSVCPIHARDAAGLLQRADVAMYEAKEKHTGFELYGVDTDRYSPSRLALVGELRHAIEAEELVVFFQPKISVFTGEVTGVEALVRWDHPRKGLIPPNDFIPLAEHTGLIKPLTMFVLRKSIEQLPNWRRIEPNLHVAVNLSMRTLSGGGGDLCDSIAGFLDEFDVPPTCLELEVTESSIMDDPARSIAVLARLSDMGIALSIDDFGTGYSSLSYLKKLPVDALKIDKSFVLGMQVDENDAIIVRSIIELGHSLGLKVIAEGVETDDLLTALRGMRCDVAQGFGISRPIPTAKLAPWLIAHRSIRYQDDQTEQRSGFPIPASN